jgi:uncharacterized protein YuzE
MMSFDATYDAEADAAYIPLTPEIADGTATRQEAYQLHDGELVLDFDEGGHLLGVEIIGARNLLRPESLREMRALD